MAIPAPEYARPFESEQNSKRQQREAARIGFIVVSRANEMKISLNIRPNA